MDEELVETDVLTVADRLRAAREAKGMSLEEVASQTRIPLRHLENIEAGQWDQLPAPTYTLGFAKSYAAAVDLDRAEIGDLLRAEMGGTRPVTATPNEVFEPADPARTMPKWLVLGTIVGVILLVLLFTWLNNRSLQGGGDPASNAPAVQAPSAQQAPTPVAPAAQGPVVIAATEPVWLQVYDQGGTQYFSGMLQAGQTFAVPGSALAPLLKTGKPEGLRITVGTQVAPPVGVPGKMVSNISLLPGDLLKGGAAPAVQPSAGAAATSANPPRTASKRTVPAPSAAQSPPAAAAAPAPSPSENATN